MKNKRKSNRGRKSKVHQHNQKPKPPTQPKFSQHFETSVSQLSPTLAEEVRSLMVQEKEILALLQDPANKQRFLEAPHEVLEQNGIRVPPIMRRRLQNFDPAIAQHLQQQSFVLPSGQTVTAQINVNLVADKKEV